MSARARAIDKTRTRRSQRIEQCVDILIDILGDRDAVMLTMLEIMSSDSDYSDEQRQEIADETKRLNEGGVL